MILSISSMIDSMTYAAFTVDVDRDANLPYSGSVDAVSNPIGGDYSPRFESSAKGLELLVDLLDEMGIKGTFFLEAKTALVMSESVDMRGLLHGHEIGCHGFEHEDLTGEDTGVPLARDDIYFILEGARRELGDMMGEMPAGFRAPYLHMGADVLDVVQEVGFVYDSSLTRDLYDIPASPWRLPNGLVEVPLATDKDEAGKSIYSYLWAMHEGKRKPDEYIRMMRRSQSGLFLLGTHSWHLVETFERGLLEPIEVDTELDAVRAVIEGGLDLGLEFLTVEEFVRRNFGR
jgi:peptidoglycan/xylan/chitin deacetylase (PgdA/CDA1 family)